MLPYVGYIRMFYILKENNIKDQTDTFHLELMIYNHQCLYSTMVLQLGVVDYDRRKTTETNFSGVINNLIMLHLGTKYLI